MWISVFDWFIAIFSLCIWVGTYIVYDRARFTQWFDNKFGKDDPMPPTPNQQLNVGEGKTINFEQKISSSDQSKEL